MLSIILSDVLMFKINRIYCSKVLLYIIYYYIFLIVEKKHDSFFKRGKKRLFRNILTITDRTYDVVLSRFRGFPETEVQRSSAQSALN